MTLEEYMKYKNFRKGYSKHRDRYSVKFAYEVNDKRKSIGVIIVDDPVEAKDIYLNLHRTYFLHGLEEVDKKIKEYRMFYLNKEASKLGEEFQVVPNYSRYIATKSGKIYSFRGYKLSELAYFWSGFYYKVNLSSDDSILKKRYVHRVIAKTFLPNPEPGLVVDHIDRNTKNNNISNLRWVTRSENCLNSSSTLDRSKVNIKHLENSNTYRVYISFCGKNYIIDSFENKDKAESIQKEYLDEIANMEDDELLNYIDNKKKEKAERKAKIRRELKLKKIKDKELSEVNRKINIAKRSKGYYQKSTGLYESYIYNGEKQISLGAYKTEEEARKSYLDAVYKYRGIKIEE